MDLRDYLEALPDQALADYYAGRKGYYVNERTAFRYWQAINGKLYYLIGLPTREEMISEILQEETL